MGNVFKLLEASFNVIVFFLAITLLFSLYHQLDVTVEKSADYVVGDTSVYEATPLEKCHYITKTELIAVLMGEPEYDMEVIDESGTYTILAQEYSLYNIGLYSLKSDQYEKSYIYNLNGNISKIIFRYVTG